MTSGRSLEFELVGQLEGDLAAGRVSVASPLGRALVGLRKGEIAAVHAPRGSFGFKVLAATVLDRYDVADVTSEKRRPQRRTNRDLSVGDVSVLRLDEPVVVYGARGQVEDGHPLADLGLAVARRPIKSCREESAAHEASSSTRVATSIKTTVDTITHANTRRSLVICVGSFRSLLTSTVPAGSARSHRVVAPSFAVGGRLYGWIRPRRIA
jgi:hypothetical protein